MSATLALIGLLLLWSPYQAGALSTACPGQDDSITGGNIAAAEESLHCLVNVYRQDNGLVALTRDARLDQAARAHSEDMVSRHFFDHTSPDGKQHDDRMKAAGFPAGQASRTGENLACASDPATPLILFGAWEASPSHRAEMLAPGYRLSGMGIAAGAPNDDFCDFATGATATNLFSTTPSGGGSGGTLPPLEGKRVALTPTRGTIRIKPPGSSSFRPLAASDDVPIGTIIDAAKGAVQVASQYNGVTELAEFASGRFKAEQSAGADPVFGAKLVGSFGGSGAAAAEAVRAARKKRGKRRLWSSSNGGHFRTRGRRASATVRGTRWLTVDIRDRSGRIRTSFRVTEGVLEIDDFSIAGKVNARVEAGDTYTARKKQKRRS